MRTLARSVTIAAMAVTLIGCSAKNTEFETSDFKFSSTSITFVKKGGKTLVSINSLSVVPVQQTKYCDVEISYVVDTNNDGDFDDPGDTRNMFHSGVGAFKKFSQDSATFLIPQTAERATIEVTGVLCNSKNKPKRRVLLVAMITSSGVTPQAPHPRPRHDGITLSGGTDNPHFMELRRGLGKSNRLMLLVGDLRGETTPLSSVYRRYGVSNKKDFLGAAIFINSQLVDIIIGEGSRTLPKLNVLPFELQIMTFDNAFSVVGHWTFEDVRL